MRRRVDLIAFLLAAGCGSGGEGDGSSTADGTGGSDGTMTSGTGTMSGPTSSVDSTMGTSGDESPDSSGDGSSEGTTGSGEPWSCPPPPEPPACAPGPPPAAELFDTPPAVLDGGSLSIFYSLHFAVDIDGDDDIDVISHNVSGLGVWRNDGTGEFTLTRGVEQLHSPSNLMVGDFDGDCINDVMYTDIFVAGDPEALWLQRGSAEGLMPPEEIEIAGVDIDETTRIDGPFDFDGDAAPDLLVANDLGGWIVHHDVDTVSYTADDPLPWPVRINALSDGPRDYDGDGIAQEIECQSSPDTGSWDGVCRVDANGITLPPSVTAGDDMYFGYPPWLIADFEGDGDLDRIVGPNSENYVFVQRLDSATLLLDDQDGSYPLGNEPLVTDIDLNCEVDAAGALTGSGSVRVSFSDGPESFPVTETHDLAETTHPFAAVDIDGDGDLDLLSTQRFALVVHESSAVP